MGTNLHVLLGFASAIAVGFVLLRLPIASAVALLSAMDAAFMATSAVCVTGLATISVGEHLTGFGQAVLLALIQLGGLGLMTLSTLFLVAIRKATLEHGLSIEPQLASVREKPLRIVVWAITATIAAEAAGAIVLALRFTGPDRWWQAVFHSVSAFCNAGFSLHPTSLVAYRNDPVVMTTLSGLIVLGGIGFIVSRRVVLVIRGWIRRKPEPLYLHSRTVLVGSLVAWIGGATVIWLLERNASFANMSAGEGAAAGVFQSITARTAGFNSVDLGGLREATLFALTFLMLIGAAPGSCGGGMKITTVSVLFATLIARVRGYEPVTMFRRTVPVETVRRAFFLLLLSTALVVIVTATLLCIEPDGLGGPRDYRLTGILFETASAFATVGLSVGVTNELSTAGRLLLALCMFVGRLGPLLIVFSVLWVLASFM